MRKILLFCFLFIFQTAAAPNTYYDILGISRDASQEDIKLAYNRMISEFHPDRNQAPDATQKAQEINEAYDILKDPSLRSEYDRTIDSEEYNYASTTEYPFYPIRTVNPEEYNYTSTESFQFLHLAERASLYGDVNAMRMIGDKLVERGSFSKSFKYYLEATIKGDEESSIKLQALYDQGIGTPSERIKAGFHLNIQKCIARIFQR
ncbi:MAG: DnaJ domain-containing protein [Bdellovibrionales bacterium]|nr:DnaJ domain-containing protein [Bdellovibrionales bacterium]